MREKLRKKQAAERRRKGEKETKEKSEGEKERGKKPEAAAEGKPQADLDGARPLAQRGRAESTRVDKVGRASKADPTKRRPKAKARRPIRESSKQR